MAVSGTINMYFVLWHYTDLNLSVSSERWSQGNMPLPSEHLSPKACVCDRGRKEKMVCGTTIAHSNVIQTDNFESLVVLYMVVHT